MPSEPVPDRLHYAAHISANTRKLHRTDDCQRLERANTTTSCPTTHPPRGRACGKCFDRSLAELVAAARAEPDTPDATEP